MKEIPAPPGMMKNPASGEDMAAKLAALAHPARLQILRHLAGAEACCCKDVVQRFALAQSTVSQHLKILVEAGLVDFAPERQRSRYTVNRVRLSELSRSLEGFFDSCCGTGANTPVHSRKNIRA